MPAAERKSLIEVGSPFADDWVMHGSDAGTVLAEVGDGIAEDLSDVVLTAGAAADVPDLPDEVRVHVGTKEWWT